MKCGFCGAINAENRQACQICGRPLTPTSVADPTRAPPAPYQQRPAEPGSPILASQQMPPPPRDHRAIGKKSTYAVSVVIVILLVTSAMLTPSISPLSTVHDADADGYADASDSFPDDPTEWNDTDGDGHGDNSDAFPTDIAEWEDSDGDGYGDNIDAFPAKASEWNDTDGDHHGDNSDMFPDNASEWIDSDGDGHGDNSDIFPSDSSEWNDTDADGHGDNSDGFPLDATRWQDSDRDGHEDGFDAFPYDPKEWADSDGDKHGDNSDEYPADSTEWADSDGDGHGDNSDMMPFDCTEWNDTDGDGHGDNSDILPLDPLRWRDPFNVTFNWTFGLASWSLTMNISGESYDNYSEESRDVDWPVYVTDDDPTIIKIASRLKSYAVYKGYDAYDTASFVLTFVQSLPYTTDFDTKGVWEYPRYPVETLVDNGGDCEDTAILFAAIMQAPSFGYDAILIGLPLHMATGIYGTWSNASFWSHFDLDGKGYLYCETTELDWRIGQLPSQFIGVEADLYQV